MIFYEDRTEVVVQYALLSLVSQYVLAKSMVRAMSSKSDTWVSLYTSCILDVWSNIQAVCGKEHSKID